MTEQDPAPAEPAAQPTMFDGITAEQIAALPTMFIDGHLGIASAHGVLRIALFEVVLNGETGAQTPRARPVVNLVIPSTCAKILAASILEQVEEASATENEHAD